MDDEWESSTVIDPNLTPDSLKYLTIIPYRSPKQRVHTTMSGAKNSFNNGGGHYHKTGTLWEWVDNNWVLLFEVTSNRGPMPWH